MRNDWPEILRDAAVLVEDNWIPNSGYNEDMCILQAIAVVQGGNRYQWSRVPVFVAKKICEILDEICNQCAIFGDTVADRLDLEPRIYQCWNHNDNHCTGGQEAAQILQKAAALMEEDVNLPY